MPIAVATMRQLQLQLQLICSLDLVKSRYAPVGLVAQLRMSKKSRNACHAHTVAGGAEAAGGGRRVTERASVGSRQRIRGRLSVGEVVRGEIHCHCHEYQMQFLNHKLATRSTDCVVVAIDIAAAAAKVKVVRSLLLPFLLLSHSLCISLAC